VPDGHADPVPDGERVSQHRDAPSQLRLDQCRAVDAVRVPVADDVATS